MIARHAKNLAHVRTTAHWCAVYTSTRLARLARRPSKHTHPWCHKRLARPSTTADPSCSTSQEIYSVIIPANLSGPLKPFHHWKPLSGAMLWINKSYTQMT